MNVVLALQWLASPLLTMGLQSTRTQICKRKRKCLSNISVWNKWSSRKWDLKLDFPINIFHKRKQHSAMTQRKTRPRRPASVSNPNSTSSQLNKTFSKSPPPTLLPIKDTFFHSRAFIKKTKVILRVRRSTTLLTCLAEHRWTSEILDILPAFDTFRNKYLFKVGELFFYSSF